MTLPAVARQKPLNPAIEKNITSLSVKDFAAYGAAIGGRDYNSVDMLKGETAP